MEQLGVVMELWINEKDYVVDAFHCDIDRLANNIVETKQKYEKELEKRQVILLSLLRENYDEVHSEQHRTVLLNYLACMEWVWNALSKFKGESMGIGIMFRYPKKDKGLMGKTQIDYSTMNWVKFEEILKTLPPAYFKS